MAFAEFCILLLAFAILALVGILAFILQEHCAQVATRVAANAPAIRDAPPPRHNPNRAPPVQDEVSSGLGRLRVRFGSPRLPSIQSVANALSLPPRRDTAASTSSAYSSGLSATRSSISGPVAGPSRNSLSHPVAGPSAGPSVPRGPFSIAVGTSTGSSSSRAGSLGGSVPWSPKKGWTNTVRVNGITYHRTEKKMRPRRSLKEDAEESEVVITPYWEPESVGSTLAEYPPDLSREPGLAIGDIFVFHTATHYRLWIYRGRGYWQHVEVGYQREDGRYLIVTPVKKEPSWVSREYFERQAAKQAEADSD